MCAHVTWAFHIGREPGLPPPPTSPWKDCITSFIFPECQTQHPNAAAPGNPSASASFTNAPTIRHPLLPSSQPPSTYCVHAHRRMRAPSEPHTKPCFPQHASTPLPTNGHRHLARHAANCLGRCCGCHCRHVQTCVPPTTTEAQRHRGTEAQHTPYASSSPQLDSACGLTSLPSPPTAPNSV